MHHSADDRVDRADLFKKLRGQFEAVGQHVQPPGLLGGEFLGPADQIALADDADHTVLFIDDRHAADAGVDQSQRRVAQARFGVHGNHLPRHQIRGGQG